MTKDTKSDHIEYLAAALNIIAHSDSPPPLKIDCFRLIVRMQYLCGGMSSVTQFLKDLQNVNSQQEFNDIMERVVDEHNSAIDMFKRDSTHLTNLLETLTFPDKTKPRGAYTSPTSH